MTTGEDGLVGANESLDTMDTSGNVTGSDFDDETEDGGHTGHMPFSELLHDPEKDESQDPPSSTTGDHHEKPGKRASQGQCHLISLLTLLIA